MVGVLMGHQDGIDGLQVLTDLLEALAKRSRAEATVDEQPYFVGADVSRVTATTTTEYRNAYRHLDENEEDVETPEIAQSGTPRTVSGLAGTGPGKLPIEFELR